MTREYRDMLVRKGAAIHYATLQAEHDHLLSQFPELRAGTVEQRADPLGKRKAKKR